MQVVQKLDVSNQFSNQEKKITTLPVLETILEKLEHKRMIRFINRFILLKLNAKKFWFLAEQNAFDDLTDCLDKVHDAINEDRVLLTIFLALSEAFKTVDHETLLKKIEFERIV